MWWASNTDCNDAVAAINPGTAEVCNGIDDNCNGLTDDGLVFVTYYADVDGDGFGNLAVSVSTCDGAPAGYVADNTDCDDAQLLYADLDGDTYGAGAPVACGVASNTDCNDAVAAINPGAAEVCNGIDDNCNGLTDDGLVFITYYADVDGDGFGNAASSVSTCDGAPAGYVADNTDCDDAQLLYADLDGDTYGAGAPVACGVASNTDCNDAVAAINPGAAEVCNGIDDNCNGLTDDGLVFITYYADVDGDGFGNAASSVSTCDGAPAGYVADNTDCDDAQLLYADLDGDTCGAGAPVACGVASNTDCNDGVATINPGAAEVCNGIDDNCNGLTDDGLVFITYYADVDGDGFGNAASSVSTCDGAPAGYVADATDCDDAQLSMLTWTVTLSGAGAPVACGVASNTDCNDAVAAINPGAAEVCNGIDDNCNGLTDDGLVFITYYADVDGDGFGNAASSVSTCDGAPAGYVADNTDCDDAQLLYADVDGDTYGAGAPVACGVASNTDCNCLSLTMLMWMVMVSVTRLPLFLLVMVLLLVMLLTTLIATMLNSSMLIWTMTLMVPVLLLLVVLLLILIVMMVLLPSTPGAAEVCNGIDDNCNGLTDDGLVFITYYADVDGDGFGNAASSVSTCDGAPAGYVADNTDCDDAQLLYADLDGDTYGAGAPVACGVASNTDCNDGVATINPGAAEACNGIDDNCNGLTDDGLVFITYYADVDGDGFGNAASSVSTCDGAPAGYVADNTDCDDAQLLYADLDGDTYGAGAPVACGVASNTDCNDGVATINPGAAEVCNGIDDNCNGLTDDGLVFITYYADVDGDGFGNAASSVSTCDGAPAGYVADNTDCDDAQLLYADLDNDTYGAGAPVACGVASNTDCNDAVAAINLVLLKFVTVSMITVTV
ncbi:MAG: putative metal-binding motif-containing protein [Bacteroidetes bacterium]|nr:putative metal-binding motif-containing protein [Bacteroidota bacterium]